MNRWSGCFDGLLDAADGCCDWTKLWNVWLWKLPTAENHWDLAKIRRLGCRQVEQRQLVNFGPLGDELVAMGQSAVGTDFDDGEAVGQLDLGGIDCLQDGAVDGQNQVQRPLAEALDAEALAAGSWGSEDDGRLVPAVDQRGLMAIERTKRKQFKEKFTQDKINNGNTSECKLIL